MSSVLRKIFYLFLDVAFLGVSAYNAQCFFYWFLYILILSNLMGKRVNSFKRLVQVAAGTSTDKEVVNEIQAMSTTDNLVTRYS